MSQPLMIIGSGGMLGCALASEASQRGLQVACYSGATELDITDSKAVTDSIATIQPTVVINAAAYTDVDNAEQDVEKAHQVNAKGPQILAGACAHHGARLVHYSTDYVFDGTGRSPYSEAHPTAPKNEYGRSKLNGEQAIAASGCSFLILRTSWLFAAHGRNFFTTIARLAQERSSLSVVNDQTGRPTYCADLAIMTYDLLQCSMAKGRVINACNDGQCTWYDFAREIVKLIGSDCDVQPCETKDFPRPAYRPPYSVLDLSELNSTIGLPRHWKAALAACVHAHATAHC